MSQRWQLPPGWLWKPLGDASVCEIIMGQSPPGNTYNDDGNGLPFFQGKTDFGETFPTARKWCTDPGKVSVPGDVLISVRAPVGPTNITETKCIIGRGLAGLRPAEYVQTRYLFYAIRNIETAITSRGTGSTFQNISKTSLSEVEIPILSGQISLDDLKHVDLPLNEQEKYLLMRKRLKR
jgi:type I restriction enzyme S subunit